MLNWKVKLNWIRVTFFLIRQHKFVRWLSRCWATAGQLWTSHQVQRETVWCPCDKEYATGGLPIFSDIYAGQHHQPDAESIIFPFQVKTCSFTVFFWFLFALLLSLCSLKTLILIVVYLNMCNSLAITYVFFPSSILYILCFICCVLYFVYFCLFCLTVKVCDCHTFN